MNLDAHIDALSQKHAELEKMIFEEEHRPAPDSLTLHELKREKLTLKDEIEKCRLNA